MKKKRCNLLQFARSRREKLDNEGKGSAADIQRSVMTSVREFVGHNEMELAQMTPSWLKKYEQWMMKKQLMANTISTYLRTLRALYNQGVNEKRVEYIPYHFKDVYTGTRSPAKRALKPEIMGRIIRSQQEKEGNLPERLKLPLAMFTLQFLLRGMPYIDLAHLRKCDLNGELITYRRHKTGVNVCVKADKEAIKIIRKFATTEKKTHSPYLFPLLANAGIGRKSDFEAYKQSLRDYNRQLQQLGKLLKTGEKLSSYTPRHTWATIAYHREFPLTLISKAMGHSSTQVTETYFKPFADIELHKLNKKIVDYIMGF